MMSMMMCWYLFFLKAQLLASISFLCNLHISAGYCLDIIISYYHPANGLMLSIPLLLQIMWVLTRLWLLMLRHTRLVVTAKSVSITYTLKITTS